MISPTNLFSHWSLLFTVSRKRKKYLRKGQNDKLLSHRAYYLKVFFSPPHFIFCTVIKVWSQSTISIFYKSVFEEICLRSSYKRTEPFAVDSSSKSDKGFVIVCVTFTHTHTHTICHGTSAATMLRKYEPISPDKTYTSKGWAAQRCLGRHRLRYMTKTKNHDSLAWEKHSIEAQPASPHQFLLLLRARCVLLSLVFGSSCRVINGSGQTGADEGQSDE